MPGPRAVVEQARDAFSRIGASVTDMTGRVEAIAAAVQQIAAPAEKVQADMAEVAGVAEKSSASSEQVSASTQQTSASAQEIAASAQQLVDAEPADDDEQRDQQDTVPRSFLNTESFMARVVDRTRVLSIDQVS
ncbi:MAG: hypothetical protein QOD55_2755, partial [Solirubrobacteraceae bacterium]|nr:hypothetical protein [Solirubrobacteraceae bacterium]